MANSTVPSVDPDENGVQQGLVALPNTGQVALLAPTGPAPHEDKAWNPVNNTGRRHLVLHRSHDRAKTWPTELQETITSSYGGYSSLAVVTRPGKASVLGAASGAVAGLVGITPAAGFVSPGAAVAIGLLTAGGTYAAVNHLKSALKFDDSLDAFGLHGVGGFIGAILTGVFASSAIGGTPGLIEGNALLVWTQTWGALAAAAYCAVLTFAILWVMERFIKLRVEEEDEVTGLDVALHGESA